MTAAIYKFEQGSAEGSSAMVPLLGGKGAFLAWMCEQNAPVPAGFTITTQICSLFQKKPEATMKAIKNDIESRMEWLFKVMGGDTLVSVRSGAPVSMPGMMDTILNVGITETSLEFFMEKMGVVPALDSYRRLQYMLGHIAMGIPAVKFLAAEAVVKEDFGAANLTDIGLKGYEDLLGAYEDIFKRADKVFPQTYDGQLNMAIEAVFKSWNTPRAIAWREEEGIPHDMGTAVTVQAMVFGNLNDQSGTGVLFTRDPQTGENKIMGEYLMNAQGEDVVAGIRTPEKLDTMADKKILLQLKNLAKTFEKAQTDMQDIEFTIENGKLWILQTRRGRRTPKAAIRIAWEMVSENLIPMEKAFDRLSPDIFFDHRQSTLDAEQSEDFTLLGSGLPVCDGIVSGTVAFSSEEAVELSKKGPVILVREETTPDDISGMIAAAGILTQTGGATSHAAVVARSMSKACVVGAKDFKVANNEVIMKDLGAVIVSGDIISIDGSTGQVWKGAANITGGSDSVEAEGFYTFLSEVQKVEILQEGVGLGRQICMAEYMLSGADPETILAEFKSRYPQGGYTLNFSTPDGYFDAGDMEIMEALGPVDWGSVVDRWCDAILNLGPFQDVSVVLPEKKKWSKNYKTIFSKLGIFVITEVFSIQEAVEAQGPVVLSKDIVSVIGQGVLSKVVLGLETQGMVMDVALPTRTKQGILAALYSNKEA